MDTCDVSAFSNDVFRAHVQHLLPARIWSYQALEFAWLLNSNFSLRSPYEPGERKFPWCSLEFRFTSAAYYGMESFQADA